MENVISCAITGPRPLRFKWKYNENNSSGCRRLKQQLQTQLIQLFKRGCRRFYVGGAMGAEMWAAESLLLLKEQPEYNGIQLVVVLPFENYDKDWDEWHKKRSRHIQANAEVVVAGHGPGAVSYKKRNYYMIDHADVLLAVYDNDRTVRSSTGVAVNYAKKRGRRIILIHPDTSQVTDEPQMPPEK